MDDISTIATIVTTVNIVIGVIFALMDLRHLTGTRETEIIARAEAAVAEEEGLVEDFPRSVLTLFS
jgi:hypothetical protein